MINFSYKNPNDEHEHRLALRVDPYNVEWTYNLNTQVFDTYGGQVIQVLSVNIDTLTIDGQFGREGPFGIHQNTKLVKRGRHKVHVTVEDPRWGGPVEPGDWVTNHPGAGAGVPSQWNPNSTPDHIGLYQFAQFFIKYFTVHSQGGLKGDPGHYIQTPMHITYDAGPYPSANANAGAHGQTAFRHWMAFPTSLPNFSRSNEEFAPLWKLEFSVYQADPNVEFAQKNDAIKTLSRIRDGIGWEAQNPWVDPAANPKDPPEIVLHKLVSEYKHFLPKITKGDLEQMLWKGISLPAVEAGLPQNKVFEIFGDDQGTKGHPVKKKHHHRRPKGS
jgi:hypothetical protein